MRLVAAPSCVDDAPVFRGKLVECARLRGAVAVVAQRSGRRGGQRDEASSTRARPGRRCRIEAEPICRSPCIRFDDHRQRPWTRAELGHLQPARLAHVADGRRQRVADSVELVAGASVDPAECQGMPQRRLMPVPVVPRGRGGVLVARERLDMAHERVIAVQHVAALALTRSVAQIRLPNSGLGESIDPPRQVSQALAQLRDAGLAHEQISCAFAPLALGQRLNPLTISSNWTSVAEPLIAHHRPQTRRIPPDPRRIGTRSRSHQ
ncbi:Uncharacterised protein [Mycobacteroides abscessus subsp. abscessus]|nr:Uncharacterised protein [Mycobacteroides abscessus subsp. abscessus]